MQIYDLNVKYTNVFTLFIYIVLLFIFRSHFTRGDDMKKGYAHLEWAYPFDWIGGIEDIDAIDFIDAIGAIETIDEQWALDP